MHKIFHKIDLKVSTLASGDYFTIMKTIEEKAKRRAFDITSSLGLNIAELIVAIHDLYIEAATEALAGQWRSVEDELPKEHDEVVVIFTHTYRPFIAENTVAYWDGEDWYTIDGEHLRPTHWMPIPELPKDESE